jgi:uncharacterized protein
MDLIELSKELLSQKLIPRDFYFTELDETIQTNQVIVIQWQRRVGKSSIVLSYFQNRNIDSKKIFFFNKELDSENRIQSVKDLNTLFDDYVTRYGDPEYIQDRERFIRARFALKKEKIIISWSNSQLLSWELATYLTGRYISFEVYPLNIYEYMTFSGNTNIQEAMISYFRRWGLPEVAMILSDAKKTAYISTVLETIIYKDIVKRNNIKDIAYLERLLHYIADVVGSQVSLRKIIQASKNYWWGEPSTATVSNYMTILQHPYLIHKARRFDIKGKKILEYNEKYYFNDIGIRNFFKVDMKQDIGKLIENIVYLHLKKCGYTVYIWSLGEKEIDFIGQKWQNMCYIQVAYIMPDQKVIDREFGNLLTIWDNYPKYVVSLDPVAWSNVKWVEWMHLLSFIEHFK